MSLDPQAAYAGPMPAEIDDLQRQDSLHSCRVLIVDDDDLVRARLHALLKASNYEIEVAASGEEALRVMGAKHCDIVLTDWQMPDLDGLALCRCVRIAQEDGYVYVIMLSVKDSKQDMLAGLAAGADDYVVKGAPIDEILARLRVGRRIVYVERSLRANRGNRHLSLIDSLTGAHNLRYLLKYLPRELARSRRYSHPLAVLTCSIDKFAQVRDHFGHEGAAEVLRAFLARSESCIRASCDWIARVGVDEFMIVLPETNASGANRAAVRLHEAFGKEMVATRPGPVPLKVNISMTAMDPRKRPDSAQRIEELIRTAHRGFKGKHGGADAQPQEDASAEVSEIRRLRGPNGLN